MSGFNVSKDKLILFLRTNAAGDFRLKPMLIYYSEEPRVLNNYADVLCLYSVEQQCLKSSLSV